MSAYLLTMAFKIPALSLALVLCAGCTSKNEVQAPVAASAAKPAAHAPVFPDKVPPPPAPPPKTLTQATAQTNLRHQYDQDGDGRVSTREMLNKAVDQLMRFDADKDGFLSSEEFHKGMGDLTLKDEQVGKLFKHIDQNHDNRLDAREVASYAWPGVAAMDKNSDGYIDAFEVAPPAGKPASTKP